MASFQPRCSASQRRRSLPSDEPQLFGPGPRALEPAIAQDHAAAVAEPHACDGAAETRQPPPADALGQQHDEPAQGA